MLRIGYSNISKFLLVSITRHFWRFATFLYVLEMIEFILWALFNAISSCSDKYYGYDYKIQMESMQRLQISLPFTKSVIDFRKIFRVTHLKKSQQKESSRSALRERYSENMQENDITTSMTKCNFNKVTKHFGINVLLKICCIFSEKLFIRTPMEACLCRYLFH